MSAALEKNYPITKPVTHSPESFAAKSHSLHHHDKTNINCYRFWLRSMISSIIKIT
jgi:hypothetical protein